MWWVGPCLTGMSVLFLLKGLHLDDWLWPLVIGVMALSWVLSQIYIWLAVFDIRATWFAAFMMTAGFTLPFATFPAQLLSQDGRAHWAVLSLLSQVIVLMGLTWWRWRQLQRPLAPSDTLLHWHGCRINLQTGRIEPALPTAGAFGSDKVSTLGATASVAAYPILSAWLGQPGMLVLAAVIGHAIALWFHAAVTSHWLAQAWTLRRIEQASGQRFVTSQLDWLEAHRQQHGWGRLLRHLWPCPVPVEVLSVETWPQSRRPGWRGARAVRRKSR
jgi:hypothetical protein